MELTSIVQIAIATTGIINCIPLVVFLFFVKKGNLKANKILSILLLAICFKLCHAFLLNIPHKWKAPSLILYYLTESGYLSFGPLLLMYLNVLLRKKVNLFLTLLMFLPAISPFVCHVLRYDIQLWQFQAYYFIFLLAIFMKFKCLYFKKEKPGRFISEKFWISTLYVSFLSIWISANFLFIDFKMYFLELVLIFIIVFYINIFLITKHYWFRKGDENNTQKYINSKLSVEEENKILINLEKLMNIERLHLNPEITLPKIANKVNVGPHKLSQVINQKMNMSFNEYINSCRISDIKNVITSPKYQNVNIASIAYDFGFNSISVFNSAFKKFTNYTPSQFRNEKRLINQN